MSLSSPRRESISPVKEYVQWVGSDGKFSVYNKETKQKTDLKKLAFIVLDTKVTVKGFDSKTKKPYTGTEVKTAKEPITVYLGGAKLKTDVWGNLKTMPGIKFATSVYAAKVVDGKVDDIIKINFSGSSLSAWLNFVNGTDDYEKKGRAVLSKVGIAFDKPSELKTSGASKWREPLFTTWEWTEEQFAQAVKLDLILQNSFDAKPEPIKEEEEIVNDVEENEEEVVENDDEEFNPDDLPF